MNSKFDVVIVGAGAAGLMCAAEAGKRGRKVLVIDNAKKPGRKILISGGGKCNFTNYDVTASHYLCQNRHFVKSALSQYSQWDFISLVSQYGIEFEERENGQLFCLDSAKQIVDMLLAECQKAKVSFRYQFEIESIANSDCGFTLVANSLSGFKDKQKEKQNSPLTIESESLVIATGGLSMPKLGATPFGYKVAEQFGLPVVPTTAGLVPFTLHTQDKQDLAELSGIAIPVEVTAEDGTCFSQALLFTHRGLSGPAILQISSYWKAGQKITINLVPDHHLSEWLAELKLSHPNQSLKNSLAKILPKRLLEALIHRGDLADKPLKQFTSKEIDKVAHSLERWEISPNGTEGYRTAEVTLGGVDTDYISSKTMQVKQIEGLYFIGEVVDVTGWLGGYNFQWCWSSGYVAGQWV